MKRYLLVPLVAALAACAGMDQDGASHARLVDAPTLGMAQADVQWPVQQWWHRYGDAQLDRLVDEAIAGSPSIVIAQARLARAGRPWARPARTACPRSTVPSPPPASAIPRMAPSRPPGRRCAYRFEAGAEREL